MIISVFGKRGSGKSNHIKNRLQTFSRALVLDVMNEYGKWCETFENSIDLIDAVEARGSAPFRFRLLPKDSQDFATLLELGWVAQTKRIEETGHRDFDSLTLVLDEIDMFCSPTSVPNELFTSLNLGRHRNLDIVCASRRPANVPRLMTANSDELILFRFSEPNDIRYLAEFTSKQYAETCRQLPRFHYLRYDAGQEEPDTTRHLDAVVQ